MYLKIDRDLVHITLVTQGNEFSVKMVTLNVFVLKYNWSFVRRLIVFVPGEHCQSELVNITYLISVRVSVYVLNVRDTVTTAKRKRQRTNLINKLSRTFSLFSDLAGKQFCSCQTVYFKQQSKIMAVSGQLILKYFRRSVINDVAAAFVPCRFLLAECTCHSFFFCPPGGSPSLLFFTVPHKTNTAHNKSLVATIFLANVEKRPVQNNK